MKRVLFTIAFLVVGAVSFAQTPEKINYQAIVRDISGMAVTNQLIGVRISILEGSTLGPEVFAETHGPTSNGFGLVNIEIGTGANTGPTLDQIDWGANIYFVKIEMDPSGGTSYSVSSISQLISVPYALHAKTAEDVDDADADPTNEYNTGAVVNSGSLEITDGGGTITVDMTSLTSDPDMDPNNEIQTLSKVGQIVTLSQGGGAFTDDVNDADNDPSNEVNNSLTLVGNTLQITDAGGTLSQDLSSLANDADSDPNNEIQSISKAGSIITLSNGGGSIVDAVNDADPDNTNELQTISKAGSTVTLSDGGGAFTDDVNDADADPFNEIQVLSQVSNIVSLSNGGGSININDSDSDASNEFNISGSLTGNDLNIVDGGGTVTIDLTPIAGGGGNPTDELNTAFFLDGDSIKITDAGNTLVCDLSPLISAGGDLSTSNELITNAVLVGTDLQITDPGATWVVDLSTLVNDADADATNELITNAVLVGNDLQITDAGATWTVDLSSLGGGGGGPLNQIGQYAYGGIIVYVDSSGEHGIVAAIDDFAPMVWDPVGSVAATGANSFFDGVANTSAITATFGAGTYAAKECEDYTGGGHTDWYLPSHTEMEYVFNYAFILDNFEPTGTYWTSTEANVFNSYQISFLTKQASTASQTGSPARVRPVRQF